MSGLTSADIRGAWRAVKEARETDRKRWCRPETVYSRGQRCYVVKPFRARLIQMLRATRSRIRNDAILEKKGGTSMVLNELQDAINALRDGATRG